MALTRATGKQVTVKNSGTGSVVRNVQDKLNETVSVLDFGADDTGATDCSTAFQNAVDSGATIVRIPTGTFRIDHPVQIPYNVSIIGNGVGASIIQAGSGISGNFGGFGVSTSPVATNALLNFIPNEIPRQLPSLASDISTHDRDITFASAHGLEVGDLFVVIDRTMQLLVENVSGGSFAVGDTVTGGTSGATGTVIRLQEQTTGTYLWVDTTGNFYPYYGGSGASASSETISNGSGVTAASTRFGGSLAAHRRPYALSQYFTVTDVPDSTTVRINGAAVETFDADACEIYEFRSGAQGSLEDVSIVGNREEALYPFGVEVLLGNNFRIDNCDIQKFFYTNLELNRCFNTRVTNTTINQNFDYDPTSGSDYYCITIANSSHTTVSNCKMSAQRHPITIGGYSFQTNLPNAMCSFLNIHDNHLTTSGDVQAGDYHGNCTHSTYRDNIIIGGIVIAGHANRITGNKIYGIGDSQSSIPVYYSELVSTEHLLADNEIYAQGTSYTTNSGAIFIWTGGYRGICRLGSPMRIQNNRIVLEGGNGDASLLRVTDTCGVGFDSGFELHFTGNNIYNSNQYGLRSWTTTNLPIKRLIVENNIFRGRAVASSLNRTEVDHAVYRNNYIDQTSTNHHLSAVLYTCGNKSVVCTDNVIANASSGGFVVQASTNLERPILCKDNTVMHYGENLNTGNTLDNGAFNFYIDPGASENKVICENLRVVSAHANAQSAIRYVYTDLRINGIKYEFNTPTGGNWSAFMYPGSGASEVYENITCGNLTLADGNGISFSAFNNAAGMSSELLDDYEEGSFTPYWEPSSGSFASISYQYQNGRYIKIGGLVHFDCLIATSSLDKTGASGSLYLKGMPFAGSYNASVSISQVQGFGSNVPDAAQYSTANYCWIEYQGATQNYLTSVSDMSTGSYGNMMRVSGTYTAT